MTLEADSVRAVSPFMGVSPQDMMSYLFLRRKFDGFGVSEIWRAGNVLHLLIAFRANR